MASIRKAQKRFEEAKDYLRRALAQGGKHGPIALTLANLHLQTGEPREAVPLYEATVDPSVDCPPTRDYLISLLNAGYWEKAHTLAQALRRNGPAIPVVSAVEARVAEYVGDLDRAHQLYSQLSELEPENAEASLQGRPG